MNIPTLKMADENGEYKTVKANSAGKLPIVKAWDKDAGGYITVFALSGESVEHLRARLKVTNKGTNSNGAKITFSTFSDRTVETRVESIAPNQEAWLDCLIGSAFFVEIFDPDTFDSSSWDGVGLSSVSLTYDGLCGVFYLTANEANLGIK